MRQILIRSPKQTTIAGQPDLRALPGGAPGGRSLANGLAMTSGEQVARCERHCQLC